MRCRSCSCRVCWAARSRAFVAAKDGTLAFTSAEVFDTDVWVQLTNCNLYSAYWYFSFFCFRFLASPKISVWFFFSLCFNIRIQGQKNYLWGRSNGSRLPGEVGILRPQSCSGLGETNLRETPSHFHPLLTAVWTRRHAERPVPAWVSLCC